MGLILDVIFIIIVIACICISVKRGFVRSFIEVIGYVLSIILALNLGGVVANFVFDNHIKLAVSSAVSDVINEGSAEAIKSAPPYVGMLLNSTGVDLETFSESQNANIEMIIDTIKPLATDAIKSLVAFIVFVILIFLVRFLAGFLNSFFSFSVFGTLNKLLGGAIGIIKGVLIATAFCMVAYFIALITTNDFLIFTEQAIENSTICKLIVNAFLGKI